MSTINAKFSTGKTSSNGTVASKSNHKTATDTMFHMR